jgi:hypothetical protein
VLAIKLLAIWFLAIWLDDLDLGRVESASGLAHRASAHAVMASGPTVYE